MQISKKMISRKQYMEKITSNKEIEIINHPPQKKTEILGLKKTTIEIKTTTKSHNSRFNQAEERIT